MARTKVIAGNWKMYKTLEETKGLLGGIIAGLQGLPPGVVAVVCPPYTSLALAAEVLHGTAVKVCGQNMSEFDEGAYTGEVSWKMLKGVGCEYVILGHSGNTMVRRMTS
jgi:triosephosphate isomerase